MMYGYPLVLLFSPAPQSNSAKYVTATNDKTTTKCNALPRLNSLCTFRNSPRDFGKSSILSFEELPTALRIAHRAPPPQETENHPFTEQQASELILLPSEA